MGVADVFLVSGDAFSILYPTLGRPVIPAYTQARTSHRETHLDRSGVRCRRVPLQGPHGSLEGLLPLFLMYLGLVGG